MVQMAHYDHSREYESPLHQYRVNIGMTIKELARAVNISPGIISSLANGMTVPFYLGGSRKGELKPYVQKMLDLFEVDVEDLFPRYICALGNEQVLDSQIEQFSMGTYHICQDVAANYENREMFEYVLRALKNLRIQHPHEQKELNTSILLKYILFDYTLTEIAQDTGKSIERIRQIVIKVYHRLHHVLPKELKSKVPPPEIRWVAKYGQVTWG